MSKIEHVDNIIIVHPCDYFLRDVFEKELGIFTEKEKKIYGKKSHVYWRRKMG